MVDLSINSFLSKFKTGVSKPSRYEVKFSLPKGVSVGEGEIGVNNDAINGRIQRMQSYFNAQGSINVKCHTATLPQRALMTREHRQNSAPFRVPYSASYEPVTFSFYMDSNADSRDYFEVWQSAVVNLGTNTINFYDEYVSDIEMVMLDPYGEESYGVTLFDAYPTSIGMIDLSYGQVNAYTTCVVSMSYKSWKPFWNDEGIQTSPNMQGNQ